MAVFALTAEHLTLNSVDYTDHIKSAVLTVDAAQLDTTDMASGGWVELIGGLKSGTLAVTWMDDVADNDVDEELFALLGTVVTFVVRPVSSAVSTSNPNYTGSVLVNGYTIGGSVGELAVKSLTFPTSGAVSRATA